MEVNQTLAALQELINVVVKLRFLRSASLSPEGCPWDLAQTPSSLTPYVIEEAYEVVDAIQTGDKQAIAEELGDLLLQVVLQAQIASEAGDFSLQEVAEGIAKKLIRRHLHVFADVNAVSMEEVQKNWETIKASENNSQATSPPNTTIQQSIPVVTFSPSLIDTPRDSKEVEKVSPPPPSENTLPESRPIVTPAKESQPENPSAVVVPTGETNPNQVPESQPQKEEKPQ